MYPILYKISDYDGKLERVVIAKSPGVYEEFIANEILQHNEINSQDEFKDMYDTPESGERYLKPALFQSNELSIKINATKDDISNSIEKIKRQYKSKIIPKRDRKRR